MAKTSIIADAAIIDKVGKDVRSEAENYKSVYEKIYSIVENIFSYEQWLGEDAREYHDRIMAFKKNFQDLYKNFLTYANYLEKSAEAYEIAQSSTESSAGKLTSKR